MRTLAAAALLIASACTPLPAFANGLQVWSQRLQVLPGKACAAPLELEMFLAKQWRFAVGGLAVGDCIDIHPAARARVCCPVSPRTCGAPATALPSVRCKRVVTP